MGKLLKDADFQAAHWQVVEGEGKGKSSGWVEDPNTLRSKAMATILDLIGEGEIRGLVNGAKSIFLDGTPVQNPDNSYNFQGLSWAAVYGLPDQQVIPGFASIRQPLAGFGQSELKVSLGPLTTRVSDPDADAAIVTLAVPALNSTDTKSGNMHGSSVSMVIRVKANADAPGAFFVNAANVTISGKSTSEYNEDHRLNLTEFGPAPWDIQVERTTPDSTSSALVNTTMWKGVQLVYDHKFSYPFSALMALQVDSQYFGTSVPTRAYEVYGLIIQVPSNYDPLARTYTGLWNGTFKWAWTNNPAWVFYDLVTNPRYGLGIGASYVDKWTLYAIARYCDAVDDNGNYVGVPDGFGGIEPRFTFNGVLSQAQDAYTVLTGLASSFRAMTYWSAGTVTLSQDRPEAAQKIFSPANVIGGDFEYSGSSKLARNTVYVVAWNNPANGYAVDYEVIEDPQAVRRYGLRIKDMTAIGCTSRGQAVRAGRWALASENLLLDTVKFRTGFDAADLLPGHLIYVADPAFAGMRMGGRVMSAGVDNVVMDVGFNFVAGQTYEISVMSQSGQVLTSQVANAPGFTDVVQLVANIATGDIPVAGAMFTLSEVGNVEPRPFRTISVTPDESGTQFDVVALEHDPNVYNIADAGAAFNEDPANKFQNLPNASFCAPPTLPFTVVLQQRQRAYGLQPVVYADWGPSPDKLLQGYAVSYRSGDNNWVSLPLTASTSIDIPDLDVNLPLQVRVIAVNVFGVPSKAIVASMGTYGNAFSKDLIENLSTEFAGGEFEAADCVLTWKSKPAGLDAQSSTTAFKDEFFDGFRVRIYSPLDVLLHETFVYESTFTYTLAQNQADGAGRIFKAKVSLRAKDGSFSNEALLVCNNPAPSVPTMSFVESNNTIHINFPPPADVDYAGVIVWATETSGFTPMDANRVWYGSGNPVIPARPGHDYYLRFLFYDSFGPAGVPMTGEFHVGTSKIDTEALADDIINAVTAAQTVLAGVGAIIDANEQTAEMLIAEMLRQQDTKALLETLGYKNGLPVGSHIDRLDVQDTNLAQTISLIGVATPGATGFILDMSKVQLSDNGDLLATRLDQIVLSGSGNVNALITAEQTARIAADTAEANLRIALAATVSSNAASFTSSINTLTTDTSALATTLAILGAKTPDGSAFVIDTTKAQVGGGVSMASRLSGLDSTIGTVNSRIATEETTRATADSSSATLITGLSTTVGGHTSSISLLFSTTGTIQGTLQAIATLAVNVNGHVTGFTINGSTQSFAIMAANFAIIDPSETVARVPFQYSGGQLELTNTTVHGNLLVDGTTTTNKLIGGAVTGTYSSAGGTANFQAGEVGLTGISVVNEANGRVFFLYSAQMQNNNVQDKEVNVFVYRNSVQIRTYATIARLANQTLFTFGFYDSPGIGTHYYQFNGRNHTDNAVVTCAFSDVWATELKR